MENENTIEIPKVSYEYYARSRNIVELESFKNQYENESEHTKIQEEIYDMVCTKLEILKSQNNINENSETINIDENKEQSLDKNVKVLRLDNKKNNGFVNILYIIITISLSISAIIYLFLVNK